jgi:3'-phosphoadenosine 5'-phosphosulfate sulfotransferase
MSKTYNVYLLGTKKETRSQRTNNVVRESLSTIITRRKNAQRNARLVNIITR